MKAIILIIVLFTSSISIAANLEVVTLDLNNGGWTKCRALEIIGDVAKCTFNGMATSINYDDIVHMSIKQVSGKIFSFNKNNLQKHKAAIKTSFAAMNPQMLAQDKKAAYQRAEEARQKLAQKKAIREYNSRVDAVESNQSGGSNVATRPNSATHTGSTTPSNTIINSQTGEVLNRGAGGYVGSRDGTFYTDAAGGIINTRTGEFTPTH